MEKYYTPAIEDIRVGYEYETRCTEVTTEGLILDSLMKNASLTAYVKNILSPAHTSIIIEDWEVWKDHVRTPYLTKEQIEAEGWVFKSTNNIRSWYEKLDLFIDAPHSPSHQILAAELIHDSEYNTIQIRVQLRSDFEYHTFYEGHCPSINEFRIIQKLINIK